MVQCIQVGEADLKGMDCIKRVYAPEGKSPCLTTMGGGHREPKVIVFPEATKKGYVVAKEGEGLDITFPNSKTRRGRLMKEKCNCLTSTNYDYGIVEKKPKQVSALTERRTEEAKEIRREIKKKTGKDWSPRRGKELVPRDDGKSNCLTTGLTKEHILEFSPIRENSKTVRSSGLQSYDRHEWDSVDELHWRKLTPLECERLQTVPDNFSEKGIDTNGEEVTISNTQRYKALGNAFTVDVIAHILGYIDG